MVQSQFTRFHVCTQPGRRKIIAALNCHSNLSTMSFLTLASNLTLSPSHLYSVAWRYYRALRCHYVGELMLKKLMPFVINYYSEKILGQGKIRDKAMTFELLLLMEIYSQLILLYIFVINHADVTQKIFWCFH